MIESPLEDEQLEPIHRTVQIMLSGSGIPFASELFSAVIASPTEKRRDAFILALANDVKELQQKENISMSTLSQNQEFVTTVIQAAHMWLRTHHETKQRALRAAMLNCARTPIDDSLRHMFLNMIDVLSPWHLDILNFFSKGVCWVRDNQTDRERRVPLALLRRIAKAFPELLEAHDFCTQLFADLLDRNLIHHARIQKIHRNGSAIIQIDCVSTEGQLYSKIGGDLDSCASEANNKGLLTDVTSLGGAFLGFISSPLDAAEHRSRSSE